MALVALIGLAGCAAPTTSNVLHGDLAFTQPERGAIERALVTLERQTGLVVVIEWDGARETGSVIKGDPSKQGGRCGIASYPSAVVTMWDTDKPWLEACALHEFVHTLGVPGHLPAGSMGLMAPRVTWPIKACIDSESLDLLEQYTHINRKECE